MKKIDEVFPDIGIAPALIVTIVISAALQLSGSWTAMFVAGVLGSLFVRRHRKAFLVGFLGVFIGWSILFTYVILTAQALVIADFFLSQLGLSGLGWLVIVISCLIGGLLGGFGALLGRSVVELVDGLIPQEREKEVE
ncbi:MAG: hypothetical protein JW779_06180 [Candidatus Thorarchaeota archaeon]|nr:hypothetical protein [Candidatus Thorarchaeota archaeon]